MSSTPAELSTRELGRRQTLSPMGRGTLSRQLVLRTGAIVALIAILLGLASTVAVRHQLMANLDSKLVSAVNRPPQQQPGSHDDDQYGKNGSAPGTDVGQLDVRRGYYADGTPGISGKRYVEGGSVDLPDEVTRELASAAPTSPTTMEIDGLGVYRVLARNYGAGGAQVVALPMDVVSHSLRKLVLTELALTLGAIVAAMGLALAIVRRTLAPLSRLASTATEVSTLELDRGEVALPMRVPGKDANPDNEVGRVGHAFNHMLNNVEGALASRQQSETKVRQFVADASHELRNPLAAIRGYAELTRRGRDQLPEDAQYAMGRIEAESERMSKLVEDMLLLARLDNDPTNLSLQPVDVVEVVVNATSDAQVSWPGKQWSVSLPEGSVTACADQQKLHQVVVNLLANANKHTPDGTEVEAGVRVEGRWAVVSVTDNGPGVDPRIKDQVFERFARADVARAHTKEGSTGLGLAIVHAVMEAHGGTASVDSVPGHTVFTLRIPLAS